MADRPDLSMIPTPMGRKDTFELDNGATVQYRGWGLSQEDDSCRARRAPSANMLTRARRLVEGQGIFLSFVY